MTTPELSGGLEAEILSYTGPVYHGAMAARGEPFIVRPYPYHLVYTHDSQPEDSFELNDATLGYGLYTSPDWERAAQYARFQTAQKGGEGRPVTAALSLEEYPLLDCRDHERPDVNARVPAELAQRWQQYLEANKGQIRAYEAGQWVVRAQVDAYERHLRNIVYSLTNNVTAHNLDGSEIAIPEVHSLLGTAYNQPGTGWGASPAWGGLWAQFLRQEYGVRGLLAMQSGEGLGWGSAPTVVLYDLDDQLLNSQHVGQLESE